MVNCGIPESFYATMVSQPQSWATTLFGSLANSGAATMSLGIAFRIASLHRGEWC
jgi:hypothetical protein